MPTLCSVFDCVNKTTNKQFSFYRFPKARKNVASDINALLLAQRKSWLNALHRSDVTDIQLDHMRICSLHFKMGKPAHYSDTKNPDWTPTLKMGYIKNSGKATTPNLQRYKRAEKRLLLKPKQLFEESPKNNFNEQHNEEINDEIINDETGISCNTELTMANISGLELLKDKCDQLEREVNYFNFSENTFLNRPTMFTYYAGLTMDVFKLVLESIKPGLTALNQRLTEFQKLLLCLMKLRLNLPFKDLGFRFNITGATASMIFRKVIILLEHMFKRLIHWPALRSTMPQSFFNVFGNSVAVILDCFEITIEKPSNLKARAQTWSSYKNKNTVKYLIAITPQGSISFISEGWGGRTSDKYITENSNLLNKILPGDVVLADRGFTISESVGFHCATLKTPGFTRGLPQLHPCTIEETRKIASVRIHVERVIGLTRSKFKILNGPVQITTLKHQDDRTCLLDSIVTVCCILTNMCNSVVPLS
ncbi:uncharacterized protein LOC111042812 [Myzus persicae]|uniref:uncharacterized protein LOC111042812 n=1 Tax=Myzus persicae TaxID=13164 RepID=UPI000B938588|nr:uncharacterized protein LOC111042812 [Myzus persicae]